MREQFEDMAAEREIHVGDVSLDVRYEEEVGLERSYMEHQKRELEQYEEETRHLLEMEQRSAAKLEHKSDILTNMVCLEEGRSVKLSQEKEARLQKLFSEREDHLRKKIEKYGGEMVSQFSPLVY